MRLLNDITHAYTVPSIWQTLQGHHMLSYVYTPLPTERTASLSAQPGAKSRQGNTVSCPSFYLSLALLTGVY